MAIAERALDHIHPLLAELKADPGGEAAFWERMARERTPLIEPDPDRPGHSLVTYVFPIGADARHVVVQPGWGEAPNNVMDRIAGTNVCHATFRYRDDVRTTYSFWRDLPLVSVRDADEAALKAFREFVRDHKASPDPHHREHYVSRAGEGLPDNVASVVALANAPDQSIIEKRPGLKRGWIERHAFESEIMGNERRVWVYTPPGYEAATGRAFPVLMAFDGGGALSLTPTQRLLDNLLADGRIDPMIAVFIDNPTDTSRSHELPCNEDFARFIETELIPWVRSNYRVSHDPREAYVTGVSYGGLASLWVGLRLPHLFGNVLSQSASLWWGPGFDLEKPPFSQDYPAEWLVDQYAASPRLPLRVWMEVGLMEPDDRMVEPNRRMKEVLEAKGYNLTYSEYAGGHDYAVWRGTLASALATMAPAKVAA
jgi:enterochelin esterase-like enzyme